MLPLFETKEARFRGAYKVFAFTVFVGIFFIWVYRLTHIPRAGEQGRCAWIGMFMAELCFGLYWILTQSCRFKVVYNHPFKERLSNRLELSLSLSLSPIHLGENCSHEYRESFILMQLPTLFIYLFSCFFLSLFFIIFFKLATHHHGDQLIQ